ncbi:MAG: hypothetical protein JNK33_05400 [Candidatus Doudnabacteria bacterium]|nr:hypothetical protein [Candidatus Doudnabacteria bacterium]
MQKSPRAPRNKAALQAHQKPTHTIAALVIGFCVVLISLVLAYVIGRDSPTPLNYADCTKAEGSRISKTLPHSCTTKDGKSFIDSSGRRPCGRYGYASNDPTRACQ